MALNDYFDNVVVINLDRRQDRMQRISQQLEQLQISHTRLSATDGKRLGLDPVVATRMSHIRALKAYSGKTLILEDDAQFCDNFNERFNEDILFLPADYDVMYLGGVFLEKPTSLWMKNIFSSGLQAYSVKESKVDYVVAELENKLGHIDINLGQLELNRYIHSGNIVKQYPSFSDIRLRNVNDFK